MKILILNYEYPPLGGGAGVITQNISERLAHSGHEVTVLTTWFTGEEEWEEANRLRIIRLKCKRRYVYKSNVPEMLDWIRYARRFLTAFCKAEKFDLCFANFAIPGGIVSLWLKKKFGLKYCIISHGHDIPWMFPKQMRLLHILNYFRIKRICLESESNFVQTTAMKENIDHFLGEKQKNIVIPNGIDQRIFKPDYALRSDKFKIVFTGRLVDQKDPITFLKAVRLFASKNRNFIVHIVGDGTLRKLMEEFVLVNALNDLVVFKGWLSKEEIVKEYQSAHVNIITSVFEGMSVALFESLACGCFLIPTPLEGIDEVITPNENAVLVNFNSPEEISEQLDEYYQKKYAPANSYRVDEKILSELNERFNWDGIVQEYEKVFVKHLPV